MHDRPLCIYHGNCADGFTAAWAMWLAWPNTEFVAGVYGQAPPDCANRDVYLLDFSYKLPLIEKIGLVCNSLTILDHHKTAQAELSGVVWGPSPRYIAGKIDMAKSGARLAWECFHSGKEAPLLVKLVEDRDLWKFELPNSKELNAAIFSYEHTFEDWSDLDDILSTKFGQNSMAQEGRAILRKQAKDIKELLAVTKHRREFHLGLTSWSIQCANLPYILASDAAHSMAVDEPFAATYYQDASGDFVFSLRSTADGVDVSEIAKYYGGGGHKHAAGFRLSSLEDL